MIAGKSKGIEDQQEEGLIELKMEVIKCTKRFFVYFFFTVIDCVLGSLLFLFIENCYDVHQKPLNMMEKSYISICNIVGDMGECFIKANQSSEMCIDNTSNTVRNFMEIKKICDAKYRPDDPTECEVNLRTFSKWFEYTASIAFTTGYGHVVTRSDMGKIVTMFYLVPTVAFTIVSYIHAANTLIILSKILIFLVETRVRKQEKIRYYTAKVFALQLLVTTLLIMGSATFYTFNQIDNLKFLDALYFTVVSLTTIGFGDFTLDFTLYLSQLHQFLILCFLWFFGMGMVASLIASLGEMVAKYKFGQFLKNLTRILKTCSKEKKDKRKASMLRYNKIDVKSYKNTGVDSSNTAVKSSNVSVNNSIENTKITNLNKSSKELNCNGAIINQNFNTSE